MIPAPTTASAATSKVLGVKKTFTVSGTKVTGLSKAEKKVVKVSIKKKKVTVKGVKAGKVSFKIGKKSYNVTVVNTTIKNHGKITLTEGQSKAVNFTVKDGAKDTIKFSSSDKTIAKVSSKATASTKAKATVKAIKEGTATITAKSVATGKKATMKVVVIKATEATATPTAGEVTATPEAGQTTEVPTGAAVTATPVVTTTPEVTFNPVTATSGTITVKTNVSGASIKVISGGAAVASVTAKATESTVTSSAIAPGVYTIEITKKGYDKVTQTVTVNGNITLDVNMVESIQTGANAVVTNEITGYENTVLVNDNAIVEVCVKDAKGNPIPNKSVVFSLSNQKLVAGHAADAGFELKGNTVVTTDAEGKASFIVGPEKQGLKSTATTYVGSIQFRASVVGSNDTNDVATGTVGFAAIDLGTASVTDETKTKGLVPGLNATNTDSVVDTIALSGKETEYIATQQVNGKASANHAVSLSVSPRILLPGVSEISDDIDQFVQEVNYDSGKYGTYTDNNKIIPLDIDTSALQYATLNFKSVKLSAYTKMTIKAYSKVTEKDGVYPVSADDLVVGSTVDMEGQKAQNDFAYQIPLTDSKVAAVEIILESAGQKITVKAQLTDANGNPVSISSQTVQFKNNGAIVGVADKNIGDATVVSNTGTTDVNGQATLVLSAASAANIKNLTAECVGGTGDYNVALVIGDNKGVKKADLYWIEANLKFTNSVLTDPAPVTKTTNNDTQTVDVSDPYVGTPWELAVKTVGNTIGSAQGELSGYKVELFHPQSPSTFPHVPTTPEHPPQNLLLKYCNSLVSYLKLHR